MGPQCIGLRGLPPVRRAVDGHPLVGLQDQVPTVHQVLHKEADVPLKPEGAGGLLGEQLEIAAHRPGDLADGHGPGDLGQHLPRPPLGQGLVVVDEGGEFLPAAHPPVGHDKEVRIHIPQLLPALDAGLVGQAVGQLGPELLPGQEGVPHIAHPVRGLDGDVARRVAGGLEDLELRPAEGQGAVPVRDDHVRGVDQMGCLPLHHAGGQHEKVALQVQQPGAHPRLLGGEGHRDLVLLLKIPVAPPVVHVGVGAQDARRGQAVVQEGLLQLLPLPQQAGVQQDAAPLVQLIEGNPLHPLQHPGISLDWSDVHEICAPLLGWCFCLPPVRGPYIPPRGRR